MVGADDEEILGGILHLRERELRRIYARNVAGSGFRDEPGGQKSRGVRVDVHLALVGIAGNRGAQREIDRIWRHIQYSVQCVRGKHVGDRRNAQSLPDALIIAKDKCLILLNWPAQRTAELIPSEGWLGIALLVIDENVGVERGVTGKLVRPAVALGVTRL